MSIKLIGLDDKLCFIEVEFFLDFRKEKWYCYKVCVQLIIIHSQKFVHFIVINSFYGID